MVVHTQSFVTKSLACAREREVKGWKNRKKIQQLTGSEHPDLQVGRVGGSNRSATTKSLRNSEAFLFHSKSYHRLLPEFFLLNFNEDVTHSLNSGITIINL